MIRVACSQVVLVSLFFLALPATPVAAASDVLVLAPGEKGKLGNPYKKTIVGPRREGSQRDVFMRYESVTVGGEKGNVEAIVTTNYLHIQASPDAKPGMYRVNPTIRVGVEQYRRIGRRLEWVKVRERTKTESFDVLVDFDNPPEIRIPAGNQVTITVPAGINFTKTKATSKGILEATSFARDITLNAKKKGKTKISIEYTIGTETRSHTWTVRVLKEMPEFEKLMRVGERNRLDFTGIPKALKVDSVEILSVDLQSAAELITTHLQDGQLTVAATKEGVGEAVIRVVGQKRKKKTWFILPLTVDIAARSSGSPSPAGGSAGSAGSGDAPGEKVEEDEGEDPIDPPRPATRFRQSALSP